MEQWLTQLWYRESAGPSLLQPLAWLYGLVSRVRRHAYARGWLKTQRAQKPGATASRRPHSEQNRASGSGRGPWVGQTGAGSREPGAVASVRLLLHRDEAGVW